MISSNLLSLRRKIKVVCDRCHRDYNDIRLIVVTKTVKVEDIKEAISSGVHEIGENYIQESARKFKYLKNNALKWHFIGKLQKNKTKYAVGIFDLIHSVDNFELAVEIDKQSRKINKIQDILLQVNIAGYVNQNGVSVNEVCDLAARVSELNNIRLKGLMMLAPFFENAEKVRPFFKKLRQIKEQINSLNSDKLKLDILSMGMTADFQVALEEGATMLRIGRAIFGERQ